MSSSQNGQGLSGASVVSSSSVVAPVGLAKATVALNAANTNPSGIMRWYNPLTVPIIICQLYTEITTFNTAYDGMDGSTLLKLFGSILDAGGTPTADTFNFPNLAELNAPVPLEGFSWGNLHKVEVGGSVEIHRATGGEGGNGAGAAGVQGKATILYYAQAVNA
jgi:hypothetical protein